MNDNFKPLVIREKNETIIIARSILMNRDLFRILHDRFPAYQGVIPTESAKAKRKIIPTSAGKWIDGGIFINDEEGFTFGWAQMRGHNPNDPEQMPFNSARTLVGFHNPNQPHDDVQYAYDAVVRPAIRISYSEKSRLVRDMNFMKRTSLVRVNDDKSIELNYGIEDSIYPRVEVTSEAPIIMFGNKTYIWLNREECERRQENIMRLLSEQGHDMALPFDCDQNRQSTDLADALPLLMQYDQVAYGDCTDEELRLAVHYELSNTDDYETEDRVLRLKKKSGFNSRF